MSKPDMNEIRPKLWLGSQAAAAELKFLSQKKVTHVLSVGSEFPSALGIKALTDEKVEERFVEGRSAAGSRYLREGDKKDPFVRLLIAVDDVSSADLSQHFDDCRVFIKEGISQGGVLVHCCEGVSRSAAVVATYLMQREKRSVAAAVLSMKEKRPAVAPIIFLEQLTETEAALKIAPAPQETVEAAGLAPKKEEPKPEKPKVNPQVFFELSCDGEAVGRLTIELFADIVPITAENFRCLCTGEKGRGASGKRLNYLGSTFFRIFPGLLCQGGDFTLSNGTGGESIYGHMFNDENFDAKHDGPGILSMANSGPNTNGSQFVICMAAAPHLDGKNVVFGKVIEGYELVEQMEQCGSEDGTPSKRIIISDCGEVEQKGQQVKRLKTESSTTVVHVLHILRKHKDLKKATSWREEKITCTKEDATIHLLNLRKQLGGLDKTQLRAKFAELAAVHSDCKSAKKGGDVGPFERDLMPKPFADASFVLKVGELSDAVSDKHGEHLILRIA